MSDQKQRQRLIVSVSGIRGIVGESLTPQAAYQYSLVFGQHYQGTIVVGRDSRKSGVALKRAVARGLMSAGCQVIDLGIATTPTVEMAVKFKKAAGGVIITASHNPKEWNGLKFLRSDGTFLRSPEIKIFSDAILDNPVEISYTILSENDGRIMRWAGADEYHIQEILKHINVSQISQKNYRVALDTVNGASGKIAIALLQKLGCEIKAINTEMTGEFAHWPEPTPANLEDFSNFVRTSPVDIGFALDPDGDRLVLVQPNGVVLNEELTLALVVRHYLMNIKRGPVVINQLTSQVHEDIAQEFGCRLFRAPVGEINVVEQMIENQAVIGGEGNGGVIDPRVHLGRDALVGMALILEYLALDQKMFSDLINELPHYEIVKEKIPADRHSMVEIAGRLEKYITGASVDETDGIRFTWPDRWLQARLSNTEPIIRIFAEAPTKREAEKLINQAKKIL